MNKPGASLLAARLKQTLHEKSAGCSGLIGPLNLKTTARQSGQVESELMAAVVEGSWKLTIRALMCTCGFAQLDNLFSCAAGGSGKLLMTSGTGTGT